MGILFGLLKFKTCFWGYADIPDIFFGWTVDAGSEPRYKEKLRVQ